MQTTIPLKTIALSPGSHVFISDVTWEQYEALLEEVGENRHIPRINYCHGTLELMSPLLAHERPNRLIAYIVTAILDAQNRDWEDFGSTTFKKPSIVGLEPDTCFYIHNAARVRSLQRVNIEQDPPPDLAIEADLTSKTTLDAYAALQVPEVWIYDSGTLTIDRFDCGHYQTSFTSPTLPDFPIVERVPQFIQQAYA